MHYDKTVKGIMILIISVLIILSISINPSKGTQLDNFIYGNSIIGLIGIGIIYCMIERVSKISDKRLLICATILGIFFANCLIIGNSINCYFDLSGILASKTTIIKTISKLISYTIILSCTIIIIFDFFNKKIECADTNNEKNRILKLFSTNRKVFFICWMLIFIAWIPYFLKYYPGIVTPDSVDQIKQALGISTLNAHHPILHTIIIKCAMTIGSFIKNQNAGIAIYSIIQMLSMSAIFAFSIYYMSKKQIPVWIRIISLFFFALYPVNSMYSITMWKNILSAGCILLFLICITEISINTEKFFKSKLKIIIMIIISLLIIYLLNNGIYIIILTLPFLFFKAKNNTKKMFFICFTIIIITSMINVLIFSSLNIKKGSIREALSIPLQQFARTIKYRENDLTNEEKNIIHKFLPSNNLSELYNPTLSDPVKKEFNDEYFKENKLEFVVIWAKLFLKFPLEYVEAFLCNCYGYWYPNAQNWVVSRTITEDSQLDIHQESKISSDIIKRIDSLIDRRDIPVLGMTYSLGLMFWLVLMALMYCIYKKSYNLILIYIPICILWCTVIASPVFCEFRYLYGMVVSMPLLLSMPLLTRKKVE